MLTNAIPLADRASSLLSSHAAGSPTPVCNLWQPPAYGKKTVLQSINAAVDRGLHRPRHKLSECVNLALTHTGSTTLVETLRPFSSYAHHHHRLNASYFYSLGVRCFITTLRDPSLRLRSGFSFEWTHNKPGREVHLISKTRMTSTPSLFVSAMQRGSNHSLAQCIHDSWKYQDCVVSLHNGSNFYNARWRNALSNMSQDIFETGNSGLVPQIDYLVGIAQMHDDVELHILCTERFATDWSALLERLHVDEGRNASVKLWNGGKTKKKQAGMTAEVWLKMSAEEAAYVRSCMFPEDTALHRRYCSSTAAESAD